MVRHRNRLRILVGILKDNSSLLKTLLLSTKRSTTKLRLAILRATSHAPSSSPSNRSLSAVLSLGGEGSRRTAAACINSLMDRLHGSNNAHVALKCLLTLHAVVSRGSFILKDQLSGSGSGHSSGRNFLNLSNFRDGSDPETWELSAWVRWYAAVIEQNLAVSRALGSNSSNSKPILEKLSRDLIQETQILVDSVRLICESPVELKSNNLVYEVVKSVGEDYRLLQREILVRVGEFRDRMQSLSFAELNQLSTALQRLQDSRDGLTSLFVNGKRNDALWETVAETKEIARVTMMEKDEMKRLVTVPAAAGRSGFASRVGWVGRLVLS